MTSSLASAVVAVLLRSEAAGSRIAVLSLNCRSKSDFDDGLGEGGFGTVYMAEQESPVRRRVAVKIIKPGMDTKQVIARFEAERQALAMMDHPNIAKVFEAGSTDRDFPISPWNWCMVCQSPSIATRTS